MVLETITSIVQLMQTISDAIISLASNVIKVLLWAVNSLIWLVSVLIWWIDHFWLTVALVEIVIMGLCIHKQSFSEMISSFIQYHLIILLEIFKCVIQITKAVSSLLKLIPFA